MYSHCKTNKNYLISIYLYLGKYIRARPGCSLQHYPPNSCLAINVMRCDCNPYTDYIFKPD